MSDVGRRGDEAIGVTNVTGKGRRRGTRWRTWRRKTCIVKVFEIISSRSRGAGRGICCGIKWARLYLVVVVVVVFVFEGGFHFIVQKRVRLCVWKGCVSNGHEGWRDEGKDKDS